MIIRKEQSETFRPQLAKGFEDRMVAHLEEAFPEQTGAVADAKLRGEIRHGVSRAAQYGIETERDVAQFIDLMFRLRRDFDTNPELPWARAILVDKSSSAENRLRRLRLKAQRHLAVAGTQRA